MLKAWLLFTRLSLLWLQKISNDKAKYIPTATKRCYLPRGQRWLAQGPVELAGLLFCREITVIGSKTTVFGSAASRIIALAKTATQVF